MDSRLLTLCPEDCRPTATHTGFDKDVEETVAATVLTALGDGADTLTVDLKSGLFTVLFSPLALKATKFGSLSTPLAHSLAVMAASPEGQGGYMSSWNISDWAGNRRDSTTVQYYWDTRSGKSSYVVYLPRNCHGEWLHYIFVGQTEEAHDLAVHVVQMPLGHAGSCTVWRSYLMKTEVVHIRRFIVDFKKGNFCTPLWSV